MFIVVKLFSIVIVCMGIIFLLSPKKYKQYISFWNQEKRIGMAVILCFLFGINFLLAASQCRLPLVVSILGILSLIKGVIFLIAGFEKVKAMFDWWDKRSLLVLRLMGLMALAVGALIFFSA